jgi:lipopolysaccharide/colanic/teichoic acid biosynthesis glycosyltransferase
LNGKPFKVWKFATMLKNSDLIQGGDITLRKDPRITKVGKFLRMAKLNESPQLFNVLKGDMSIVGPRPLMEIHFNHYSKSIRKKIYSVNPGITSIASVILRDEEYFLSNTNDPHKFMVDTLYPFKGKLELFYQKHASLFSDFMIILLTAWVIIFPNTDLSYKIFKDLPKRSEIL